MALPAPGTSEYANLSPDDQQKARDEARGGANPESGYFTSGGFQQYTNPGSNDGGNPGYQAPAAPTNAPPPNRFPTPQELQQQIGYSPANPSAAWRNVMRDAGLPGSVLMRGGPIRQFFESYGPSAYYQFLTDAAKNNYALNSESFKNYLGSFVGNLGAGPGMGDRLGYLSGLQNKIPTSGDMSGMQFSNPAEAALMGLLATQPYDAIASLLMGQYAGALPPALISQYIQPLMESQLEPFADQAQELGGKSVFDSLSPFFFGKR